MPLDVGIGAVQAIGSSLSQAVTPLAVDALSAAAYRANAAAVPPVAGTGAFGSLVAEALKQVNATALTADQSVRDYALGRERNLHHVMIALEEASISVQFAMAVRNKVVEAYQEVSRMQI